MLYSSRILDHPGPFCKAIREVRSLLGLGPELKTDDIARACYVGQRHIQRFESGETMPRDDVLWAYISTLDLQVQDAIRLMTLCGNYRKQEELEEALHYRYFDLILEHPQILTTIEEMRRLPYPALLLDPLSFVLAMNDLYLRLYNIESGALSNPYLWHLMSAEFSSGSPVGGAHVHPRGPYQHHLVCLFNEAMAPYYFTQQSRSLQQSLFMLSPRGYGKAWSTWVLMLPIDYVGDPICAVQYRDRMTYWRARLYEPMMVEVDELNHQLLPFRLLALAPASPDAFMAIDMMQARLKRSVVVARNYGISQLVLPSGLGER